MKQRPRSGNLTQSQSFLAIPKDKEELDDEIRMLKKQLHAEKADKALLKTEFNRLREFLGKIKKERMSEARKAPGSRKLSKNADLSDVANNAGDVTVVGDKEEQNTALRLKIKKFKTKIDELKEQLEEREEQISKFKSKTTNEVEYSAKLRKDLLE
jgi:regulator of replication initiation timing